MILTAEVVRLIENQIKENPLKEGEIRRLSGMGGLYMTSVRLESPNAQEGVVVKGEMQYWLQYELRLNGTLYCFYGGEPTPKGTSSE